MIGSMRIFDAANVAKLSKGANGYLGAMTFGVNQCPPGAGVGGSRYLPRMRRAKVGGWVADLPETRRERRRGWRGRTDIGTEDAVCFERCRSVHTLGMRTPITVVFLDASWNVIRVERVPSGRVLLCRRARHVLECHIGADVRVGDVLRPRP